MRTPCGWTPPRQKSWPLLCVFLTLWNGPAASVGAPKHIMPPSVVSASAPAAAASTTTHETVQIGGLSFDRRVLALVAMVCLVPTIAGRAGRGAREPRVRLLTRPKKTSLTVLVPPGPAPRLVPGESPNATRARPAHAPVPRQAPAGAGSGIIDYIAPFAGSGEGNEKARVDYLLESGENVELPDSRGQV
jgi:hypothetical protein